MHLFKRFNFTSFNLLLSCFVLLIFLWFLCYLQISLGSVFDLFAIYIEFVLVFLQGLHSQNRDYYRLYDLREVRSKEEDILLSVHRLLRLTAQ